MLNIDAAMLEAELEEKLARRRAAAAPKAALDPQRLREALCGLMDRE